MSLEKFWEDYVVEIRNQDPDFPDDALTFLRYTLYVGAGAALSILMSKEATFPELGMEVKSVIEQMKAEDEGLPPQSNSSVQ